MDGIDVWLFFPLALHAATITHQLSNRDDSVPTYGSTNIFTNMYKRILSCIEDYRYSHDAFKTGFRVKFLRLPQPTV